MIADVTMHYETIQDDSRVAAESTTLRPSPGKGGRNDAWNRAVEIAYKSLTALDEGEFSSIQAPRALEANAAAAYFRAWRGMPLKWRGTSRLPMPEAWKEIGQRTSVLHLAGSRNASHPLQQTAQLRLQVDHRLLELAKGQVFDAADFTIRPDGVHRLNPEMAKVVVQIMQSGL